jgi:hypothetical protein
MEIGLLGGGAAAFISSVSSSQLRLFQQLPVAARGLKLMCQSGFAGEKARGHA